MLPFFDFYKAKMCNDNFASSYSATWAVTTEKSGKCSKLLLSYVTISVGQYCANIRYAGLVIKSSLRAMRIQNPPKKLCYLLFLPFDNVQNTNTNTEFA